MFQGGYAGERPKNTIIQKFGCVKVEGVAYAELLNGDDPDVRFAYTFCGSIGTEAVAEATKQRGIAKAQFKEVPAILPKIAEKWAASLQEFKNPKLVVFIGIDDHRGLAILENCRFDFDMEGIDAVIKNESLSIRKRFKMGEKSPTINLKRWALGADERLSDGLDLKAQMRELGIIEEDY